MQLSSRALHQTKHNISKEKVDFKPFKEERQERDNPHEKNRLYCIIPTNMQGILNLFSA